MGATVVYSPVEARSVFAAPMSASGDVGAELGTWVIQWVNTPSGNAGLTGNGWTVHGMTIDPNGDIGSQIVSYYNSITDQEKLALLGVLTDWGCAYSQPMGS